MWLPRFVCPECRAALEDDRGAFSCGSCGHRFEHRDGVYRFLTSGRVDEAAPFLRQYRIVREREGRLDANARWQALPEVPVGDRHAAEWRLRRESYAHLLRDVVADRGERIRIVDLGAGNGWLSIGSTTRSTGSARAAVRRPRLPSCRRITTDCRLCRRSSISPYSAGRCTIQLIPRRPSPRRSGC